MSKRSKLLEEVNEARPLIDLQASFTTFRVTSGPWKNRFWITGSIIIDLFGIFLALKHLMTTFDGEINMNMMMSALVFFAIGQYPLKSLCGLIQKKIFHKLLEEIEQSYSAQEDDEELNKISEKHLVNALKIWKFVSIWIFRLFALASILISLQFRFTKSIGLIMDWSFLPADSMFWNEIPYFFQLIILLTTALSCVTADMTTIFISLNNMASLDILNDYIRLINEKIKIDPDFLKIILKRHCKVIDNINLLNEAVYQISFIQMIISTLAILLTFVFIREETMQISGYTTCLCGMVQIFPLCVFGEMIKIKTEKLSETFYEVNWYELSLKDQKTYLIILGMAQRQYGLKAAGMYTVDIYAFYKILKLAFSYCAILYSLSK
ncbi:Odorant receptor [Sergentomyia squamirostris]